jgi:hypothetical protein
LLDFLLLPLTPKGLEENQFTPSGVGVNKLIFKIIPLLYYSLPTLIKNNTKKKNQIVKELFNYAEESNCKISKYDYWSNTKIGVDNDNQRLFFIRKEKQISVRKEINLMEIQKAQVITTTRSVGEGKNKQSTIDKIELALTLQAVNKPDSILEFYNTDYDRLSLTGELQLAEKWAGIINSIVKRAEK